MGAVSEWADEAASGDAVGLGKMNAAHSRACRVSRPPLQTRHPQGGLLDDAGANTPW